MKIAELSRRTGVPVATIKYYLREHLLPPGELTSPNQARYDETHVHQVRLVRALVEVGGLSIAATRQVVELTHASGRSTLEAVGKVHFAVLAAKSPAPSDAEQAGVPAAAERVDALIASRGWRVRQHNPARAALAEVLAYCERLGQEDMLGLLDDYAEAADRLATAEVTTLVARKDVDSMAENAVMLTVLGNALLAALRGLAQESVATELF